MVDNLDEGSSYNGFLLIKKHNLDEYRSIGYEFLHEVSGLKLFHIYNDDEENTFSFSFNTPTKNSTGVPHIIEHSVLSGSELYNLKDPFQSMMTGSVNTFLNAYTFPDKTSYPASSVLEKDFFNLMSVYGDAVFFPRLTKETFLQEGWRYTLDDDGNLDYSGVVYNEMKGVYSSHESIVADMSVRSLYDSGVYTHDSGGDPNEITNLSYEEFLAFHKKWYRPSNCYVYLYGNIETEKHLKFLEENILKRIEDDGERYDGTTTPWGHWDEPKRFHKYTPATTDKKHSSDLLLSWKLFDLSNPEEALAIEVLNKILLGSSAAPLYRVISESTLWDDLSSSCGVENELSDYAFTVGVRGAAPDMMDEFRSLVLSTLEDLVKNGLDKELVEGAIRTVEFKNREIQGSLGLRLMRRVLRGWLHGHSPVTTLSFEEWMKEVRERKSSGNYFEKLIEKYLLNNMHRAEIVVEPSLKESERQKVLNRRSLKDIRSSMTTADLDRIREENRLLKLYQDKPDSTEAVEKLPRLTRSDIPRDIRYIDTKVEKIEEYEHYYTDLYTNGISYMGLGFNMEYLDKFFFEYLLIFTRMFTQTGFTDLSYDEVSKRVSLHMGGIGASMETSNRLVDGNPDQYIENFYIRVKSLEHSFEESVDLLIDFLTKVNFHDYNRLKSIITELRNDLKASLIPSGSSYAALRSARKFSLASCREESWYGVTQAQFLDDLVAEIDEEMSGNKRLEEVAVVLDSIKREIITRQGLYFHSSAEEKYKERILKGFKKIIESLPMGDSYIHPVEHYDLHTSIEGLYGNTQVSYSGLTVKGAFLGSKEYASQVILCYILKTGYLWENVRMKGGAYGVFCSPSGMDGAITFGSYRDPNITSTIEHYKTALEWVAAGHITQEQIDLALISVIGKELKPLTPIEKSIIGMRRHLLGITDKLREDKRLHLMDVTPKDISSFAAVVLHHMDEASVVVLSSRDELESASESLSGLGDNLTPLPL